MDANYFEGSLLGHDDSKCREEGIVGFECNICLDPAQDAVVTICGHLYCWKCIYKWMHLESDDKMEERRRRLQPQQCPVCKAQVSERSLIPLYAAARGGGDRTQPCRPGPNLGILIPPRPSFSSNSFSTDQSHRNCTGQLRQAVSGPYLVAGGMNAEMIYERILGSSSSHDPNSYGSETQRIRSHLVETERSLSKLCLFLLCFVMYCLVLF